MTSYRFHRVPYIAFGTIVALVFSATSARAQIDLGAQMQAEALAAAAKASPKLVQGLAKELGSTPEQAAGAAGVLFGIAKSFLKPDDFAKVAKAVPGMDALLATVPMDLMSASVQPTALSGSALTPGFASSSSSPSIPGMTMAAPNGIASAVAGFSKLGIKPDMIAKAIPFLSDYLKKYGGTAVSGLLGSVFKAGK